MKVRHVINVIQFPHNSYVMLQAWLVMQAWSCNLNEFDGLLRHRMGVGRGWRREGDKGGLAYSKYDDLHGKLYWLSIFGVNFRGIAALNYFSIYFKDHP